MSTVTHRKSSRVLSAGLVAVVLGAGAPGFAAPPKPGDPFTWMADVERQRWYAELRKRGNEAVKDGRRAEAIEAWLEAYKLIPSRVLACAIGRTMMLGRANGLGGALWLTRCVNMAPIPEHSDKDAAKELAAQQEEIVLRDLARARVGALRVITDKDADVHVDGRTVGKAPLDDEVFLEPGLYRVAVSLGSRSRSIEVRLSPGESRTVELSLPSPPNRALLYSGIGGGIVNLGLTIGFGAAAISLRGQEDAMIASLTEKMGPFVCRVQDMQQCDEIKEVSSRATAFTVASLLGLSATVAGGLIITYALVHPPSKADPRVQAAFIGSPGGGAFVFKGNF